MNIILMASSGLGTVKDLKFCPYTVLKLDPKSSKVTQQDVNRAFRSMARVWHPDKNQAPEARDMFEKIKLASQVLLSEELRSVYDKVLEAKWAQEERMKRAGLDRQRVVEELL